MKTSMLLDHEPIEGGHLVRLLLRVEAEAPPQKDRLPLKLCLVLDRSGSMHGDKLQAARDAAAQLVRRLAPEDVVSVVAYDDQVETIAEPATGEAQADLARRVERIETGGSTNLSGGWLRGRELVSRNLTERGVNRVILLTDGLANHGITDPQRLTGLAAQGRTARISTTAIGFGEDYDERLLRAMADAGGGNMYYIETTDQATSIFADELEGLLDLGAQNVAVTVKLAAAAQLGAVHHDYPAVPQPDGMRLELCDIYAREPKPLLVELLLPGDPVTDTLVAELVVAADVLMADGGVEHQVITTPVILSSADGARVEPEVRRELLLLAAAKARQEALERRERGDYEGAAELLRTTGRRLREHGLDDKEVQEEASDVAMMAESFAAYHVSAADQKYMAQRSYNSRTGRRMKDRLISRKKRSEEEPPAP